MKFLFTSDEIMSNRGCYNRDQVEGLSFIKQDQISLVDIMKSEISIIDKRWFLFNKGELSLDQRKELAFLMAKSVGEIYNKRYPNDSRVNECLQAIQDFKDGKISRDELIEKRRAAAAADAAAAAYAYAAAAAYAADAAYAAEAAEAAAYAAYAAYAYADAAYAAYAAADAAAAAAAAAAYAAVTYTQKLQAILIGFIESQITVSV